MVDNNWDNLWAEMYPDSKLVTSLRVLRKTGNREIRREIKPLSASNLAIPSSWFTILSHALRGLYVEAMSYGSFRIFRKLDNREQSLGNRY